MDVRVGFQLTIAIQVIAIQTRILQAHRVVRAARALPAALLDQILQAVQAHLAGRQAL